MMLNIMSTPANWPRNRGMSASIDSASRSTTRSRNCWNSTRKSSGSRAASFSCNLGMDQICNLAGHPVGVLLDRELRENALERGQFHERTQVLDGIVGDKLAAMKNDDART